MKTYSKRNWKKCGRFRTISDHFFANHVNIFHKTEVQTVVLRGLTGLDSDWFHSYGLRCNLKLRASLVNSQKIATDKWKIYDHIWPFFANCMLIFHKIEIQMVILRCLTSLNLNWYKSYDTKCKKTKNANVIFCRKLQKNGNENICVLCHICWTNKNSDPLSISKWSSEPQFCERQSYSWQKNG